MDDLTMTRLCAAAMGIDVTGTPPHGLCEPLNSKVRLLHDQWTEYDPLHNDEQAMALVKAETLDVTWGPGEQRWVVGQFRFASEAGMTRLVL